MKTTTTPLDDLRLVRTVRPAGVDTHAFSGWGPRVPGI
jgi:hypothetical protein